MSDAEVFAAKLAGVPFAVTVPETLIPVWYVALKLPAAAGVTPKSRRLLEVKVPLVVVPWP